MMFSSLSGAGNVTSVPDQKRYAFTVWLRTGRLPPMYRAAGLEFEFGPYHDPRDVRSPLRQAGNVYKSTWVLATQVLSLDQSALPQIREALAKYAASCVVGTAERISIVDCNRLATWLGTATAAPWTWW